MVGVFVQYTTTRDTFLADESIPAGREHFGLLSQDINAVVGRAWTCSPNDTVHFGVSYGRDEFERAAEVAQRQPAARPDLDRPEPATGRWTTAKS